MVLFAIVVISGVNFKCMEPKVVINSGGGENQEGRNHMTVGLD